MTKINYVGFNGYHTCPLNSNNFKIISNWRDFIIENLISISCGHRVLVTETQDNFNIHGIINFSNDYKHVLKKEKKFTAFGSNDEYIIACEKTNIYKFRFDLLDWEKMELNFEKKEEECIWNEEGNEVVKCIFIQNAVIFLISNGSLWKLVGNCMSIVYTYDVEKAVDVCAGFEHCLVLTESGCVLSFGGGSRGQLGHGDLNSISEPVQISALEGLKVVKISAGGWHSCAITDSGDLCVWGWNNYGQLSSLNQEEVGISAIPEFVDVGPESDLKVVDVACGTRHTIANLENGDLYSTGWNAYCQLGIQSSEEKVCEFTKCNFSSHTGKVVCGPWYTILIEE